MGEPRISNNQNISVEHEDQGKSRTALGTGHNTGEEIWSRRLVGNRQIGGGNQESTRNGRTEREEIWYKNIYIY